ncbi:MAG: branched-chain amino acid ABC transporter permease, partial [Candidatus Bipolaricaulota bacterium]|nr:branched-chain amino acid ABC transporter permease [Candidatus Bipolaricaulota bacterium]
MIEQYIVLGLVQGSLYALMALGMVLIFKTTDVVNFGQADMTMFSAYVGFTLLVGQGWPFWAALPVVIAFGFLLGVAVERLALRPAKEAPVVSLLIVTLGVALMLNALASWIWGFDPKSLPYAISGPPLVLGNIIITRHDLVVFGTTIVLSLGFFALLKFTKIGTAMRAAAQNTLGAQLLGIPVFRINMLSWGLGVALGAVAG